MALADLRHRTPASRTFCGDACLRHLATEIDRAGATGVAIVASRSARRHKAFTRLTSSLGDRAVTVFDGVREHTPLPVVESLAEIIRDTGAQGLVAVGGGSAIVTARAGAIAHGEELPVVELATRRLQDGSFHSPRLNARKIPTWVVPTTPTTAYARVGAAVRDPATGGRLALYDPATRAAGVFIDPELALSAPASVALGAALNAVSMAAEGLQSRRDDPMADALLGHGLRMLLEWLPELIAQPDAGEPRMRLMLGALMAGQGSEFTGGGLAQTLAHAAGPLSNVSNGVLEAILLPHTLSYNLAGDPKALDAIARHLGLTGLGDPGPVRPQPALRAIADVLERVQVPGRLREVGIAESDIPTIAQHVMEDWFISQVPRTAEHDDVVGLLREAW